jgi:hypothetical protein
MHFPVLQEDEVHKQTLFLPGRLLACEERIGSNPEGPWLQPTQGLGSINLTIGTRCSNT